MTDHETLKDIETWRKRLIFRSWHRGTREMDLLMGSFADKYVPDFTEEELAQYEELLQTPDPDVYDWISRRTTPPANIMNPVMEKLVGHVFAESDNKTGQGE